MKRILGILSLASLVVIAVTFQSCFRSVDSMANGVKYDTIVNPVGQVLTDCAGKNLTITKGAMRLTQTFKSPTNVGDSVVYTFTIKANELQLIDQNQKRYESSEKVVFQVKAGPKSNPVFSMDAKFHLESNDHTVLIINFKIHEEIGSNTIVVDKGVYDSQNMGCIASYIF
jgi:hypothetical protein